MNREHAIRLMNRFLDGAATASERKMLAGALRADPVLRQEFEELQVAHRATQELFRHLELPEDFSSQVMSRVQSKHIPTDAAPRIPEFRPREVRRLRLTRARRNRTRMFGVLAGVSAAAAVLLAAGVFTGFFARNGIGQTDSSRPADETLADGREGLPGTRETDRTDFSTRQPAQTRDEAETTVESTPRPPQPDDAREPEPGDDGATVSASGSDDPGESRPRTDDPVDDSVDDPVMERDDAESPRHEEADPQPKKPESDVVKGPSGGRTEARDPASSAKSRIGSLSVLSGRVDMQTPGGAWERADEGTELHEGVRLKTSTSGVVLLSLDNGSVTLGKRSEAELQNAGRLGLIEGSAGLDRDAEDSGESLEVLIDEYAFHLALGAAVIERKYRGFSVSKSIGVASITHESLGTMDFDNDQPGAADVKYGEPLPAPTGGTVTLPTWSANARAVKVMQNIDAELANRDFHARERAYVDRNLPRALERVMQYSVTCDSVEAFLKAAIANEKLDGRTLKKLVDELEVAILDFPDIQPPRITTYALLSCNVAEDFNSWRSYFYELLQPTPGRSPFGKGKGKGKYPEGDYPDRHDGNKAKRVDKPRRKHPGASSGSNGATDGEEED